MSDEKSWYSRGFEAGKEKMDEEEKSRGSGGAGGGLRWWMPKDMWKTIVFLTNDPFIYDEVNWRENGNWRNWDTSVTAISDEDPYDLLDNCNRYAAAGFTVLACDKWTDKEGKEHNYNRQLLVAKSGIWEAIEMEHQLLKQQGKSLRGAMFQVHRSKKDKAPAVGDTFKFERMVGLEAWHAKDASVNVEEFNYVEMLAPNFERAAKNVQRLMGGGGGQQQQQQSSGPQSPGNGSIEDIPF